MFSFVRRESTCVASDFIIDADCSKVVDNVDCVISSTSEEGIFDGQKQEILKEIEFVDSKTTRVSVSSPKCSIVELKELSNTQKVGCGYFCFFHQLDKFYENEKAFSCRYIPPEIQALDGIALSISQKEITIWEETVKVVTVETYCAQNGEHSKKRSIGTPSELSQNEKTMIDEVDSTTKDELSELKQKLEQESLENQKLEKEIKEQKEKESKLEDLVQKQSIQIQEEVKLKDEFKEFKDEVAKLIKTK